MSFTYPKPRNIAVNGDWNIHIDVEDEVREIIQNCTDGRFLGIFGEETVNVLEVNLMLDGILEG